MNDNWPRLKTIGYDVGFRRVKVNMFDRDGPAISIY